MYMTNDNQSIEKTTLRIGEASKYLGVSTMTLRRWDKSGVLKPILMGKRNARRYRQEVLDAILNNREI